MFVAIDIQIDLEGRFFGGEEIVGLCALRQAAEGVELWGQQLYANSPNESLPNCRMKFHQIKEWKFNNLRNVKAIIWGMCIACS